MINQISDIVDLMTLFEKFGKTNGITIPNKNRYISLNYSGEDVENYIDLIDEIIDTKARICFLI